MVKPKLSIDSAVRIQAIRVRSAAMTVRWAPRSLGMRGMCRGELGWAVLMALTSPAQPQSFGRVAGCAIGETA